MNPEIEKLFDMAITYWPETIDTHEKKLYKNATYDIPELTRLDEVIEDKLYNMKHYDAPLGRMSWIIYTLLHIKAQTADIVKPCQLDSQAVTALYLKECSRIGENPIDDSAIRTLFDTALTYWPETIEIHEKAPYKRGIAAIQELKRVYDSIQKKLDAMEDDQILLGRMHWIIYMLLHTEAQTADIVKPYQLERQAVEASYLETFSCDDDDIE